MIYKYLSPTRIDVLRNRNIRATQPDALNDPFELRPFISSAIRIDEVREKIFEEGMIISELRNALRPLFEAGRLSLTPDQIIALLNQDGIRQGFESFISLELDRIFEKEIPHLTVGLREFMYERLGAAVGIISFSATSVEELMWAHYADSHRGFVLGFSDEHRFFDRRRSESDEFFHLRQVDYFEVPPSYSSLSELDGRGMFCAKSASWRYERERRLLIPISSEGGAEAIHLVDFPPEALREVVVGARAAPETIAEIREVLEHQDYEHVLIKKARIDLGTKRIRIDLFQTV